MGRGGNNSQKQRKDRDKKREEDRDRKKNKDRDMPLLQESDDEEETVFDKETNREAVKTAVDSLLRLRANTASLQQEDTNKPKDDETNHPNQNDMKTAQQKTWNKTKPNQQIDYRYFI